MVAKAVRAGAGGAAVAVVAVLVVEAVAEADVVASVVEAAFVWLGRAVGHKQV